MSKIVIENAIEKLIEGVINDDDSAVKAGATLLLKQFLIDVNRIAEAMERLATLKSMEGS